MLLWLGKDPNSEDEADLKARRGEAAGDPALRPHDPQLASTSTQLANGEVCVAVGYSGDVLQAARPRRGGRQGARDRVYRSRGKVTLMWFDTLAIPADAPHPDEAHAFIDYLMRPDVAAANSNLVNYANGNAASVPLINELRDRPERLSVGRGQGATAAEPGRVARVHAHAEPDLDPVHDGSRMTTGGGRSGRPCMAL